MGTNGPKRTKILQWFACQKLAEMAPKERFHDMQKNGYCFQFLFPGALQDKGEYNSEMYQRDFLRQCISQPQESNKEAFFSLPIT